MSPEPFPPTPAHVFAIAEAHGGGPLLSQLILREQGDVVIFAAPTANGPCFAATTFIAKQHYGQPAPTADGPVRGFRPGKAPKRLLVSRLYGGSVMKSVVERAVVLSKVPCAGMDIGLTIPGISPVEPQQF